MKSKITLIGGLIGGLLIAISATLIAGTVTLPNTFTKNTPAVAAEVNANFNAVATAVNDNAAQLAASVACLANTPTRFTDMGDGTICDGDTGLMWEKKLAADDVAGNCADATQANRSIRCMNNTYTWTQDVGPFTEPDGTLFTDFLARINRGESVSSNGLSITQAGYTDWRIPNVVELRGILLAEFPNCPSSPCIDGTFGPAQASLYWSSSSTNAGNPGSAWNVDFSNGSVNVSSKRLVRPARAVRGGR